MKAVVQRTKKVNLFVGGKLISRIEKGLTVYFGVKKGDEKQQCEYLAQKISALRVFEDENGKMNLSVKDIGGEIMLISQFTLLGDLTHGNRPSFSDAEEPSRAKELYEYMGAELVKKGVSVKYGVFGADMKIEQFNDGPVTVVYDL
ncbi:MAG: D-tyrosyl-tRNA(Tyr) deacylase [Clostridia bacterium]|nr:D-tyrosyl-tRNA(Tyr) deacylase [Clostridia bacterium]